jgi:hypothetical protein
LNIEKCIKFSICYFFLSCVILFFCLNNYYITTAYSHISNDNNDNNLIIQEIIDQNDKIKVQFGYYPEKININTLTNLKFSILNSTTAEHLENILARIVVTEGVEVFQYDNIIVDDGDFSINHSFANYGNHQVILRVDTNSSITLASFNIEIPLPSQSSSPPSSFLANLINSIWDNDQSSKFTTYLIIGVGLGVSIGIAIILLLILKKK